MSDAELARLRDLLVAAQAQVDRPFEPGESSRPITFFSDHLSEEGWTLGWKLVATLRREHAELFAVFSEQALHRAALEHILSQATPLTVEGIAAALLADRADHGDWIVEIPLANSSLDRFWAPAGPTAALLQQEGDGEKDETERIQAAFDAFHHLGDHLRVSGRVLTLGTGQEIDTGRGVSLFIVESGPARIATEAARVQAHYALATWVLLERPAQWHLFPDVGLWAPQPYVQQTVRHKRFERDRWVSREQARGGALRHWAPYELPRNDVLAAPFEAFEKLERRSAQALLSSTAAWFAASRGSRFLLSQRIREVQAAIECLCEREPGSRGASERWKALADNPSVWDRIADVRAYGRDDVSELQERILDARNISSHGADASLIDLGWRGGDRPLRRKRVAAATGLTGPALHRDLGPLVFSVGEALRGGWRRMREADFDDDEFEALFAKPAP